MALLKRRLPAIGLIFVCVGAAYAVAQNVPAATTIPAAIGDLATAVQAEVRAADGKVVLAGQFGEAVLDGRETERTAKLTATAGSTATGTAEIELVTRDGKVERELELDAEGLSPNTAYTFVVDQQTAATFTTNAKGEAEVELEDVR
jgi:hypothetical protein